MDAIHILIMGISNSVKISPEFRKTSFGIKMKDNIARSFFSLSGASIAIGVVGFMSSIVTMFVDVNSMLSVKWFLLTAVLFLSTVLILIKIIYDFSQKTLSSAIFENPIQYIHIRGEDIFVIRRNEIFVQNIFVGCYIRDGYVDKLAYLGIVKLIQDNIIQITIIKNMEIFSEFPSSTDALRNIMVRSVVPFQSIQEFFSSGDS